MPRDDDQSLGDEATLQGGKVQPAHERSLGDRSTFGGSNGSSLSDLGEFADLPDHDMEIVDLSSRYKIEKSLGKGGMGEVLLATDTRLDRKVAIKRIRGEAGSSKAAVARFLTEAKSVAALNHHNIVQIHDYGRDEEGPFLIMEYVPGGTLLDRCKQGPIELEEAVELACQLCDGLGRAHDAGIIHRDIKPANILLTHDNVAKLTDFGLAKAESRDHTMTMAGAVLGTLDFMPPEQRRDAALTDHRSDLWSLAATLYQMVTGASPKVIRLKKVPAQLRDVLDKALEESKDERFQSASELKFALQQSLQGVDEPEAELEQGKCPSCGTKNGSNRKFCRSCAGSLEAECLSCAVGMPVWEDVCGSCGTRQSEVLANRREEMMSQKLEAETFLAEHDYNRATELAVEIGNETDPRLQQLKSWSNEFPEQVESTKRAQIENTKQAISEALSHEQAYDYSSGIRAFSQIPDSILAGQNLPELETARDVLARLQEKQGNAENLEAEIKSRIKSRNLSGLLFQVESLLGLLPERADLLKLQKQLQKRESDLEKARVKTLSAAKASMQQHDYAGVLSVIAKLNREQVDSELAELQSLAKTREARSQEISTQVRQAVNNFRHHGLLVLVEEFLTLKPHDDNALKARDELVARDKKEQAEAATLLVQQREEARRKRAVTKELAAKQRARKLQIIVGSSIAVALVIILPMSFYLRAQKRARDISEALGRGDYVAALQLDPSNAEALSMKSSAMQIALSTALRDHDYRKALQIDPSNAPALFMKKVDSQRVASDGYYTTALLIELLRSPPITNSIGMKLKSIPPARLKVGWHGVGDQLPPHEVIIKRRILLGVYEVTQEQYERVIGTNPSRFKGSNKPVEKVNWEEAVEFCEKLSAIPAERAAGRVYRLPTEGEWEHVCRLAKQLSNGVSGENPYFQRYAWLNGNSEQQTHPVGQKEPNALGIYDMQGNVWEWCSNYYQDSLSQAVPGQTDSSLPDWLGPVVRGCSWFDPPSSVDRRIFYASIRSDGIGFRIVCVTSGK